MPDTFKAFACIPAQHHPSDYRYQSSVCYMTVHLHGCRTFSWKPGLRGLTSRGFHDVVQLSQAF